MSGVERPEDISSLLLAWSNGEQEALKRLTPLVYLDLRRIARRHLRRQQPDHTLESADLANEAYLKLVRANGTQCEHRPQFFALCAQIIRRILVDHARRQNSAKGGGGAVRITLDEQLPGQAPGAEVLALDSALSRLAEFDARKSKVVELRYFSGLSVEETSEVLGISTDTVLRDWKMAKVWLLRELERS